MKQALRQIEELKLKHASGMQVTATWDEAIYSRRNRLQACDVWRAQLEKTQEGKIDREEELRAELTELCSKGADEMAL